MLIAKFLCRKSPCHNRFIPKLIVIIFIYEALSPLSTHPSPFPHSCPSFPTVYVRKKNHFLSFSKNIFLLLIYFSNSYLMAERRNDPRRLFQTFFSWPQSVSLLRIESSVLNVFNEDSTTSSLKMKNNDWSQLS